MLEARQSDAKAGTGALVGMDIDFAAHFGHELLYHRHSQAGALMVVDEKYSVDIFLGIGGGPEGVLAASALDAYNCSFQGRFLFSSNEEKDRAKKMGINDFNKKYELNEIVTGDSIFCATGITSGDLVSGIEINDNKFISETLITHKSTGLKKIIKTQQII